MSARYSIYSKIINTGRDEGRCESLQLYRIHEPRNYRCIHLGCSWVSGTVLGRKLSKFPRWLSKHYSGFRLRGFNELVAEACIIQRTKLPIPLSSSWLSWTRVSEFVPLLFYLLVCDNFWNCFGDKIQLL